MKKELDERVTEKSEVKLELERYKDLLGLREKEIQQLKARELTFKKQEDTWKKKIAQVESEKKELSQLLVKVQRSGSPYKGSSRTHFQIGEEPIKPEDLIGETDEFRQNYAQFVAGSKTHKSQSSNKGVSSSALATTNPQSITSHTQYLFKTYGATERNNSTHSIKQQMVDNKFKKDLAKAKNSNREILNRSAMAGLDANQISIGKSPDRSKNASVYSHGPTANLLGNSQKSPYLGTAGLISKGETIPSHGRNSSMENALSQVDSLK